MSCVVVCFFFLTWCLDYKREKSCFTLRVIEKFKVALEMGRGWQSFPSPAFGRRLEVVPGAASPGAAGSDSAPHPPPESRVGTELGHGGHPAPPSKHPTAHPLRDGGCEGGDAPAHGSVVPRNGSHLLQEQNCGFRVT